MKRLLLLLLIAASLPAMRRGCPCPPVGRGYTVTYTITYDFRPAGVAWQVEYARMCACDVTQ